MDKPLLYNRRKFDIRGFALWTTINGFQKGYYYNDGYIRTSCKEYNLNDLSCKYVHLTNDAIQKYSDDYGKYESGNKVILVNFINIWM
jgi:tubulin--tyrosine ligase